ncbi:translation initiation factor IF-2 [Leptospira sp. 2 VSF19]|uniref:Translation initiation factor IF-2 n=1 Tax=Leptospira soteropolitanensis TaxID=2950025 RepID=A0AAW5VJS4_9LEPT|nr:translation initiation factor IF-2 [Leptospira soteropolitanensis]MCW7492361.1 translation initiation factor IF-2 [Leptospira soteropolitanensis]MCW7499943.1 translation initiation factor IF-2 [Leptospira soteropolitanensis]MCW7522194.1 translation initiation factor IF-2 [Leptospira soteropolitanensis]MCW7526048.1 translation initiation factor IF-2 [Leptospira soteropolitanensis]MCW7529838.1 translation initiation factor IF-2 [Leptospira soteropolitanensis]
MEEQKSIKETLQQGASGDKTKKKLVIKKKSAPADEKKESSPSTQGVEPAKPISSTPSAAPEKKKDLNELIREEAKRQGLGSGPQAPSQASPIVSRPERKPEPQPERERPPMDRKPESILSGDTSSPNYRSGGGQGGQQGGGNQGYFRKEDRNPIVSRPTTPRPQRSDGQGGGGYQGNRGPGQGGGGYQGNRGPGQGGGGYQGNRGPGQGGGGYQGNRGPGQGGGGYQGNRGPGQGGGGYQGNRGPGQGGPGGYQGNRGARPIGQGGPGGAGRPPGDAPFGAPGGPPGAGGASGAKKKVFDKEKGGREENENTKFFKQSFRKQKAQAAALAAVPKEISILENIQVGEIAKKLNLKPGEVISKLMKMGMMVTINNVIDAETASILADDYGCKVKIVSLYDETVIEEEKDDPADYITRPPVVTIMGHVDHGKTKLLDTIRSSRVAEGESGGITQHIGAYQVETERGKIAFLDTPGHEAFTSMRARGASVTDIVVLVVAADDGVMPQTIEAINHAKEAEVPIIVAVNKIDLPAANPEKVRQELSNYGLQPEDWGGTTIFCDISAKNNIGIDKLLEMLIIQAELLDHKANPKRKAKGTIVEAKLDPGRGAVATVLIQNGTLRVGDAFVAGVHAGRVRAMYDDLGRSIKEAGPSFPALVTGLDGVPDAGAPFDVVIDDKEARTISHSRQDYERLGQSKNAATRVTLDNMSEIIKQGALKELKVIIKADVRGSTEAVKEALEKLSTADVRLNVIHAGTGAIVDSDIILASASNAIVIGFHTRANPKTVSLAEKEKVEIKYYSIIYDVVNEVKASMEGMLEPEKVENIIGKVEIRDVFKISKVGNIAGCMVKSGKVTKQAYVRVVSSETGEITWEGKIKNLKRMKDDVADVLTGFECGILLDGFNDFSVGDEIEAYEIREIARKL